MSSEPPTILPPAEQLAALRALDIFHPWDSIEETRLCCRCGQIISGREIKVVSSPGGEKMHLECPTEGCPAVPIEWIMIEGHDGSEPMAPRHVPPPPAVAAPERDGHRSQQRPGFFGFFRRGAFVL